MSDVSKLKYPNRSHRKEAILPKESKDLAEFFGIMMGDGGIGNPWQATITLNSVADAEYSRYVSNLCKKMFGILPAMRKRKTKNALVISLASTTVVDFLVSQGLPRGNKLLNGLKIPQWIFKRKSYQISCLRGLIDTDGCIYVHRHLVCRKIYRNITLSFKSYSPELILFVVSTLEKFGIKAYITGRGTDVCVYQEDLVRKYLKIVGTSNSRIRSVYKKWRDARVV